MINILTTTASFLESNPNKAQEIFYLTGVLFFIKDQAVGLCRQRFQAFAKTLSTPICTTSINNYFRCLHYHYSQKPIFDLVYKYYYTNVLKVEPNISFNARKMTFRISHNLNFIPLKKQPTIEIKAQPTYKFDTYLSPSYPWHLHFVE